MMQYLGAPVVVSTTWGETVQGKIFAFDKPTNCLVIQSSLGNKLNFRIVKVEYISTLQLLPQASGRESEGEPLVQITRFNEQKMKQKEAQSLLHARQEASKIGVGVSRTAQDIFYALDRLLPTRWDGSSIIVLDEIRVDPPYGVENCHSLSGSQDGRSLNQVLKIIESHKKKIQRQN